MNEKKIAKNYGGKASRLRREANGSSWFKLIAN
jgi:hypothetical protein